MTCELWFGHPWTKPFTKKEDKADPRVGGEEAFRSPLCWKERETTRLNQKAFVSFGGRVVSVVVSHSEGQ